MSFVNLQSIRPCFLLFLLIGLGLTGCNKSDIKSPAEKKSATEAPRRFIFITNGDDPYFDVLNAGLQAGAENSLLSTKALRL